MARLGLIQRALRQAYREARAAGVPDEITHGYLRFGPDGMTPAAKAARAGAEAMGFDTDTAVYRGLTRPYDADSLAPGRFQFLAHDPYVASGYARNFADRGGANVVKAFLRREKPLVVDAGGANWDRVDTRNLPEELRAILDPRAAISSIATAARARGYRHLTARNVVDMANGGEGSPTSVEVVFDPSNIRSPNATFDPRRRHWNNLLAATTAGAPIGLLALLARRNDEVA